MKNKSKGMPSTGNRKAEAEAFHEKEMQASVSANLAFERVKLIIFADKTDTPTVKLVEWGIAMSVRDCSSMKGGKNGGPYSCRILGLRNVKKYDNI